VVPPTAANQSHRETGELKYFEDVIRPLPVRDDPAFDDLCG
jgi:hypothetical protein